MLKVVKSQGEKIYKGSRQTLKFRYWATPAILTSVHASVEIGQRFDWDMPVALQGQRK